ncbi:unnamed protein product [Linum trigynum]|uniref:Reverse transcriptase n=1 Tax=Linum trigynum TaxID=586398 RepID=A0AAV2CAD9_9ROSI
MERLSHLITNAVETGSWKPIKLSNSSTALSHLFFADNLILFSVANPVQVQVINQLFEVFGSASTPQISRPKSRVYFSKNISSTLEDSLSNELGIPQTSNLGRYLGVPVIHDRVSRTTFMELIDRIDGHLAGWSIATLSLARRITLTQSVLASLLTCTMQTTFLPASVREYIDRKIRGFIWGSSETGREIHMLDWSTLCRSKEEGSLGMWDVTTLNETFMMKIA